MSRTRRKDSSAHQEAIAVSKAQPRQKASATARVRGVPTLQQGSADPPSGPNSGSRPQKGIASVETAGQILRVLESAGRPIALKDLAKSIGMSTGAAHHYLVSLVRIGLVRQHAASSQYDLGPYALQIGLSALARINVVDRAAETLMKLRELTGESCCLVVWGSYGPTIVSYLEGLRTIAVEMRAGFVLPLVGSATGNVFLTWEPEATIAPVLHREIKSPASPSVRHRIAKIRQQVQRDGLGFTNGGVWPRVAGMASPVFEFKNRLAAVIASLGWSEEFDLSIDGPVARALRAASLELTAELGGQPPAVLPW